MTANGWLQFLLYFAVLVVLMRPLGIYMARVFEGQRTFADPILKPLEKLLYRLCGINADVEMNWREYTAAMLLFSFVSLVLTYVIERTQLIFPGIRRARRSSAGTGVEYGGLVHDEHQLAGLRA